MIYANYTIQGIAKFLFSEKGSKIAGTSIQKFANFCSKQGTQNFLSKAGILAGAASVATAGMSAANGQATGNLTDVAKGFIDLNQEQFHENGAGESGTMYGTAGKIIQDIGIGAFNLAIAGGKLTGKFNKSQLELIKKVTQGLMLWQGATIADEFVRSDSGGFEDTVDKVRGGISVMGLASSVANLSRSIAVL